MGSKRLGKYFRFNMSRSGVSLSGGIKGFRLSISPRGIKRSITVPGTGYTSTKTLISFKKRRKKQSDVKRKTKSNTKAKVNSKAVDQVDEELVLHMAKRKTGISFGFLGAVVGLLLWILLPKFNVIGLVIFLVAILVIILGLVTNRAKAVKYINKGIRDFDRDKYEQAIKAFVKAHDLIPEDEEIIYYLAVIHYIYVEDHNDALYYFNLLDQESLSEDMKLAIADCYYETEDYDASIEWVESFKFDDEEDMERLTLLAKNHIEKRNFVLAEGTLKSVVGRKKKMTPYLIEAKYWLGVLYLKLGDEAKAKTQLMKVYLEDGDFENIRIHMDELGLLDHDEMTDEVMN